MIILDSSMKRKAYLLLELLIAFSLLTLCAIPLIRTPLLAVRQERASFEKMEIQRLATLGFAEVLEKLYKNEISKKILEATDLPLDPLFKNTVCLDLPKVLNRKLQREIFVWSKSIKEGTEQNSFHLLKVKVVFYPIGKAKAKNSSSFTYSVFLDLKKNK